MSWRRGRDNVLCGGVRLSSRWMMMYDSKKAVKQQFIWIPFFVCIERTSLFVFEEINCPSLLGWSTRRPYPPLWSRAGSARPAPGPVWRVSARQQGAAPLRADRGIDGTGPRQRIPISIWLGLTKSVCYYLDLDQEVTNVLLELWQIVVQRK